MPGQCGPDPIEAKTDEWYEVGLEFAYVRGSIPDSFIQSGVFIYSIVRAYSTPHGS